MALSIEAGATNTVALYVGANGSYKRFHFGTANFKLMKSSQLEAFFQEIKTTTAACDVKQIAIGMPGVIADQDKKVSLSLVRF